MHFLRLWKTQRTLIKTRAYIQLPRSVFNYSSVKQTELARLASPELAELLLVICPSVVVFLADYQKVLARNRPRLRSEHSSVLAQQTSLGQCRTLCMRRLADTSLEANAQPRTPKLAADEPSAPVRCGAVVNASHAAIKRLLWVFFESRNGSQSSFECKRVKLSWVCSHLFADAFVMMLCNDHLC